ncbi:hypothetical protein FQN49_001743 [Arthroderma sp. PD_2]|nr:hypothetical protein FQN49_001743 [Arthroderma sp. PD_2]
MANLDRIRLLVRVSRPIAWVLPPSTFFLGILQSGSYPQLLPAALLAFAFSIPLCLILFGVNDVYDHDSDMINPRKGEAWDGARLPKTDQHLTLFAANVSTVLIFLFALPVSIQSPQVMGYVILSIFIAWTYSAPPLRFKERPFMDSLSNGICCWSVWAAGYAASGDKDLAHHGSDVIRDGLFIVSLGSAFHSLAATLDAEADAAVKQRTIATVSGVRLTALFSMLCFIFGAMLVEPWTDIAICSVASATVPLGVLVLHLVAPSFKSDIARYFGISVVFGVPVWCLKSMYYVKRGWDANRTF